jgi:hypothetical protein
VSPQPPFYTYLNRPVMPDEWTERQRAILTATEAEVDAQAAEATGAYGGIEDALTWIDGHGWHARIKTPFYAPDQAKDAADRLYWVGLTPHGTSGWNGRPDHQVGDVTLRGALWRSVLLMLDAKRNEARRPGAAGAGRVS